MVARLNGVQEAAGSNPVTRTTSEQISLCSDVFLCLRQKRRHPLRYICSSFQNRTRCAGLRFCFLCLAPEARAIPPPDGVRKAYRRPLVQIQSLVQRRRGRHIVRGDFFAKVTSHSFCRGSFPTATRFAGLAVGSLFIMPAAPPEQSQPCPSLQNRTRFAGHRFYRPAFPCKVWQSAGKTYIIVTGNTHRRRKIGPKDRREGEAWTVRSS